MFKIFKSKRVLLISIGVLFTLVLGLSYSAFIFTTGKYKASELLIGKLNYGISIKEDGSTSSISSNVVTIPSNTKSYFVITITSVNPVDSKYTLAYKSSSNVSVKYTDRTSWKSSGFIKGYDDNTYSKKVRVLIDNSSNSTSSTIDFAVFGGYSFNSIASISLGNGYVSVTGSVTETTSLSTNRLVDIVEDDTDCITSESNTCLIGGENEKNYVQYPEATDKTQNIWRITGTYNIDSNVVTKMISTKTSSTSLSTLSSDLTSFYNSLEDNDVFIYSTNKFNCSSSGCTSNSYNNIGLLTKYEYDKIGGLDSYLSSANSYYIQDGSSVVEATTSGIKSNTSSNLKPVVYLNTDVQVTGSGTASDPYVLSPSSDINLLSYTLKGETTTLTYSDLLKNYVVDGVTCKNGTTASWNYSDNSMTLSNIKTPDYCTINFKDGYGVSLTAVNGTVSAPANQTTGYNGSVTFSVSPADGYKAELETDTCGGTLSGTTYTVSNVTESKNCSITFKKSGSTLATLIKSLVVISGQGVYSENGYRYEGSDPNNYIKMKKSDGTYEMWRIIGVFNDGASGEEVVRVRRYYAQGSYPTMAYDSNNTNHWPNTTMYSSLSSTYKLSNYANTVNFKMYLGTSSSYTSLTSAGWYSAERGSVAGKTSSSSYSSSVLFTGSVGLMYPSDFGYGVLASDCARTITLYNYNSTSACYTNNWLYQGSKTLQWLISPSTSYANAASYVGGDGMISKYGSVNYDHGVSYPIAYSTVMALSASTTVTGSGTYGDPYVVQ